MLQATRPISRRLVGPLGSTAGLIVVAGLLALLVGWQKVRNGMPIVKLPAGSPLPYFMLGNWPARIVGLALFGLALAEIPVMLFALRRLRAGWGTRPAWPLGLSVAVFVAFTIVYSFLCLLLTNRLDWCIGIGASSTIRWAAGIWIMWP